MKELGIEHKRLKDTVVATVRANFTQRKELRTILARLAQDIPQEYIAGPAFCIFQFITSVKEGFDVEAGYPVKQAVEIEGGETKVLPAMEVLTLVHKGPVEELRGSYRTLYGYATENGLISDEFCREVYTDSNNPEGEEIEVQFVIHQWNRLLGRNLERVLGSEARQQIMHGSERLTLSSTVDERFRWVKGAMKRLEELSDEDQRYDVVSSCAHIFPKGQIAKLKAIFETKRAETNDPLQAVDAVIEFMGKDPGWGERPLRKGRVIFSTKQPRDPQGFADAKSDAERRKAYCFCPLVRNHLNNGMPISFCYCGAGWYRQQWEGAIGKPVKIEIVTSVLKGDQACQFAIELPDVL